MVDDLLNQLSSKFSNMSSELIGKSTKIYIWPANPEPFKTDARKVDEMSRRLDALEASIHGSGAQGKDEEGDQ